MTQMGNNVISYNLFTTARIHSAEIARRRHISDMRQAVLENPSQCNQELCLLLLDRLEQSVESNHNLLTRLFTSTAGK